MSHEQQGRAVVETATLRRQQKPWLHHTVSSTAAAASQQHYGAARPTQTPAPAPALTPAQAAVLLWASTHLAAALALVNANMQHFILKKFLPVQLSVCLELQGDTPRCHGSHQAQVHGYGMHLSACRGTHVCTRKSGAKVKVREDVRGKQWRGRGVKHAPECKCVLRVVHT